MAREKAIKVMLTFFTTTDALRMEKAAQAVGIEGRLIPVPRQIASGCGMAWSSPREKRQTLIELAEGCDIDLEGVHELLL